MSEMTKSRWGRMRSGGSTRKLLGISLGGGLAIALAVSVVVATLGYPDRLVLAGAVFASCFWPVSSALVWVLLVSRDTLSEAPRNIEDSVESRWTERVGAAVFLDTLVLLGAGAFTLSILRSTAKWTFELPLELAFSAVMILLMLDFMIRYLLIKRREG